MIFNERSMSSLADSPFTAKSRMLGLMQVCKKGREAGLGRLAVRNDFYDQLLHTGYTVKDWVSDTTVGHTLKNLLMSIIRQPYIDPADTEVENRFILSDTLILQDNSKVEGLAIAYLYNTVSVSLHSDELWNVESISLTFKEEGFEDQNVNVKHACRSEHITTHEGWIGGRVGKDLPVTLEDIKKKVITLSGDHHGNDVLKRFSKKLVRSQYVIKIINSLPFNSFDRRFIKNCYADGRIEIVLVGSDKGLGLVLQSTGKNLQETERIAEILEKEFKDGY